MNELILCMELIGTVAFAVSGAMTALRRQMDLLGVLILGLITAVGGGILRDLLLGITPPKIFDDPLTVCVALAASAVAFLPPVEDSSGWYTNFSLSVSQNHTISTPAPSSSNSMATSLSPSPFRSAKSMP